MKRKVKLSPCVKRGLSLLTTIAVMALTTSAVHAADLGMRPYAPPPPALPVSNWTGFYFGVNGGFGGDRYQYPFSVGAIPALGLGPVSGTSTLNSSGGFGGAQAGYNWQFAPAWVAGVEADFHVADRFRKYRHQARLVRHSTRPRRLFGHAECAALRHWRLGLRPHDKHRQRRRARFGHQLVGGPRPERLDRRRRSGIRGQSMAVVQDRISVHRSRQCQYRKRRLRRRAVLAQREDHRSHCEGRTQFQADRRALGPLKHARQMKEGAVVCYRVGTGFSPR